MPENRAFLFLLNALMTGFRFPGRPRAAFSINGRGFILAAAHRRQVNAGPRALQEGRVLFQRRCRPSTASRDLHRFRGPSACALTATASPWIDVERLPASACTRFRTSGSSMPEALV